MGNDISARQMLSQRITLSLDNLCFLKLKVWKFFLWLQFLFWKCVFLTHVSLLQSDHLVCCSQTSCSVEVISLYHSLHLFFQCKKNKILGFSALCSFHSRIVIFEIILHGHLQLKLLYVRSAFVIQYTDLKLLSSSYSPYYSLIAIKKFNLGKFTRKKGEILGKSKIPFYHILRELYSGFEVLWTSSLYPVCLNLLTSSTSYPYTHTHTHTQIFLFPLFFSLYILIIIMKWGRRNEQDYGD